MVEQVYRGRKPKASPLWQCLSHHFDEFLEAYKERFQPRYGFLRPIIPEVVEKFLECGDLARGFARIRCDHCKEGWPSPARAPTYAFAGHARPASAQSGSTLIRKRR